MKAGGQLERVTPNRTASLAECCSNLIAYGSVSINHDLEASKFHLNANLPS